MNNWIFLSKEGKDEYINMFAMGTGGRIINSDDFNYNDSEDPIVLRGILKHKIMKKCWLYGRDFYFMDTGYMGNQRGPLNPMGWKHWHRIVKNDLQHDSTIIKRPDDRFKRLAIPIHQWKKGGRKIIIAKPDEKPMKFYGLELDEWLEETISTIKKYTDRPIVVRERVKSRIERMHNSSLKEALDDDTFALVTFNSNAATEAVMYGYPAFTLSPTHAAKPVTSQDLSQIETPYYPDFEKVYAWACHLAYGQFHNNELKDGTAWRILNES
jgi:hypothetical protein